MSVELDEGRGGAPGRVLIAGGGVAALEGLLALRELAGSKVEIELMAPEPEFVYRPLAVAEPFGAGPPARFDLEGICSEHGAAFRRDALRELDSAARLARTAGGAEVGYDALLLAIGAIGVEDLPGALTFGGTADAAAYEELLGELEVGTVRRVLYVVPEGVFWPLPLYELALMTAADLERKGVEGAELRVATHEPRPLSAFGRRASNEIAGLLEGAGVGMLTSIAIERVEEGSVAVRGGGVLEVDRVVALPRLEVADIPGVPQGRHGFIGTDTEMRVEGETEVWAAGDATWFPIKQGGLAAQQADTAAAAIAARMGADVERAPFRPVIRAAMLTGSAPHYLRTGVGGRDELSAAGREVLWWPPSKIAGRYLAPYLATYWGGDQAPGPLEDVDAVEGEDAERAEVDHREAVERALTAADAGAGRRDYEAALRWLDVAEQLEVVLPPRYAEKRRRWREELQGGRGGA
jgi:sulfide:quinone oxidoreductase